MCGIAGVWERGALPRSELLARVEAMTATLRHRGPDDGGTYVDARSGATLGNRRLAVIDLSEHGHQPMTSHDGRYVLAYNGEVYNHANLRHELTRLGHRFRGASDTEVLLTAVQRWGIGQALDKVNGMFALALWDRHERSLVLARDRFGEKPLYYGWCGDSFLFGSELKALRAHPAFAADVDRDVLALYFRHNCVPSPYSIYRGVAKLPPGTLVTLGPGVAPGDLPAPDAYWSLSRVVAAGTTARAAAAGSAPDDPSGVVDELDALLGDAVALRMHADVPVGCLLSGGIDSSLVAALMADRHNATVRTFTIAFDDAAYDEAGDARAVARHLGTEHLELTVTAQEALDVIPTLPSVYDEPFADSSQVPTTVLARLTRAHVTVALAGDGGDELFGGYNRYAWARHFWSQVGAVPRPLRRAAASLLTLGSPSAWDRLFDRAAPLLPGRLAVRNPGTKIHKAASVLDVADLDEAYMVLASHFTDPARLVLGATEPPTVLTTPGALPPLDDAVERMMYLDTMTYLPDDILAKVDRATMAASLEARLPFLDHRVAALAWGLPLDLKLRQGAGKWILRRLLDRYVPAALVERPKAGFGIPLAAWLRGPLRAWAADLLDEHRLSHEGYLDAAVVSRLWQEHLAGGVDRAYELWDVLMFEAWLADAA
jgi:asparagine synthase (glutamine-hydrolysing)